MSLELTVIQIDANIRIKSFVHRPDQSEAEITCKLAHLCSAWVAMLNSITTTGQDDHKSIYTTEFLRKRKPKAFDFQRRGVVGYVHHRTVHVQETMLLKDCSRVLFDNAVAKAPPTVDYDSIMNGDGVADWTRKISTYGFSFVNDCPVDPDATEKLLQKIGPIRETHYGMILSRLS